MIWSHPPGSNRRPADYEAYDQLLSYSFLVVNMPLSSLSSVQFGGFCMGTAKTILSLAVAPINAEGKGNAHA
jgi:hypothetical protein